MHPQKRILIGLHGLAEVGKSTAALTLCQQLELHRYIIAQPITMACAAALDMSHQVFLSLDKNAVIETLSITKRRFMQRMGDSLIADNPNALIRMLEERITINEPYNQFNNGELVEDVRTNAEANWIRSRGGIVIHIRKPDAPKAPDHRTERGIEWKATDLAINNDGSTGDYQWKLKNLAQNLRAHFGTLKEAI